MIETFTAEQLAWLRENPREMGRALRQAGSVAPGQTSSTDFATEAVKELSAAQRTRVEGRVAKAQSERKATAALSALESAETNLAAAVTAAEAVVSSGSETPASAKLTAALAKPRGGKK